MTEALKEQLSAFLDGALPSDESELLLKRLCAESELSRHAGRYWLIGETLRECRKLTVAGPSRTFASRVCAALATEELQVASLDTADSRRDSLVVGRSRPYGHGLMTARPWLRRTIGLAMAASVGAVAVLAWEASHVSQQITAADSRPAPATAAAATDTVPTNAVATGVAAPAANTTLIATSKPAVLPTEAVSTGGVQNASDGRTAAQADPSQLVETARQVDETPRVGGTPAAAPSFRAPRLADFVMAHSEYSSPLGRRAMLSGILAEDADTQGVQDVSYVERVH